MLHHTESMIRLWEDMDRQANQMEQEVKMMLEMEGRSWGIELDRRKNCRALLEELISHQTSVQENASEVNTEMTWAYVPSDIVSYDTTMPDDYEPYMGGNEHNPSQS
jgi:hypothetical protein